MNNKDNDNVLEENNKDNTESSKKSESGAMPETNETENIDLVKTEDDTSNGKKKKSRLLSNIILIVCAIVFVFSVYNILVGLINGAQTKGQLDDLRNKAHVEDDNNDDIGGDKDKDNPSIGDDENQGKTPPVDIPDNKDPENYYDDKTPEEATGKGDENNIKDNPINTAGSTRSDEEKAADPKIDEGVNFVKIEDIDIDKISYLKVNLDPIVKLNKDTKGWIYFPGPPSVTGLPIDISILQTKDNDYYLNRSFDKSYNQDGWVYADYECDMKNITSNYNTVIYGHARSYMMFGGLKTLSDEVEWYTNANNHFIKINTLTEETIWQVFSWYETTVYNNYIKTDFANGADFVRFATEAQSKSEMPFFEKFEFNEDDRILTLSTCKGYDKDVRVAVHAKLVKSRKK